MVDAEVRQGVDDRVAHAGVDPTVPDSPIPFAPNGFSGVGVSVRAVSKLGRSVALGTA